MSGRVSIVLVEDNPADVLLVRDVLEQEGIDFVLQHFANGEDAAKGFAKMVSPPDLILLDINIPRIDGLELLRLIRDLPVTAQAPTAVLTSSQAPQDRARAEQFGADDYISKPSGYFEFRTQVGGAIRRLLNRLNPARAVTAVLVCICSTASKKSGRRRVPRTPRT